MSHSIDCTTKVLVIRGVAKHSGCDRETNPAMGRKNPCPSHAIPYMEKVTCNI